jgi:hypothetical protein
MPVIACPGCGKQYKIAATAAGQVAKCACGKRFRLGGSKSSTEAAPPAPKSSSAKAPSTSAAVAATTPKRATARAAAPVTPAPAVPAAKDDFWDDTLPIADKPAPAAVASNSSGSSAQSAMIKSGGPAVQNLSKDKTEAAPKKKKKKKSGGIKWGFDWGKVVAGLASFLIFGGLTVALVMSTGRFSRGTVYLAVPAIAGLFTAINGLMGEEGIW